jgi:hypothetical protein
MLSDIEATVFGGIGESPEISLKMSVLFIAFISDGFKSARSTDTYLFSSLAHTCNLVKADSTVDVCISELLLCW